MHRDPRSRRPCLDTRRASLTCSSVRDPLVCRSHKAILLAHRNHTGENTHSGCHSVFRVWFLPGSIRGHIVSYRNFYIEVFALIFQIIATFKDRVMRK